jgi:hypothetical protein
MLFLRIGAVITKRPQETFLVGIKTTPKIRNTEGFLIK